MSDEDDKPDRQVESIQLEIGKTVKDTTKEGKTSWITIRELGKGAFGTVYHVVNETTRQEAALKIEPISAGDNLLKIEREIMEALAEEAVAIHIFDDGIFSELRFIVMTLCGPDLQKIAELMNYKFKPETILRVAMRTLLAIKTLHEKEYVHRDLKPCNFALDYQPTSLNIFLFDYGMARKYARKEKNTYWLRRARPNVQFRGTPRYCSPNMHKRKDLGRVDDVWSWFYMLLEMSSPLPWASTTNQDLVEIQKTERITEYMNKDPFIKPFIPVLSMLGALEYGDRPDYQKLFEMLNGRLKEIDGKLSGPMEYDEHRISEKQAEQVETVLKSFQLNPREPPKLEDESTVLANLTAGFNRQVIPSGNLLPEGVDFFGHFVTPDDRAAEEKKKQQKNSRKLRKVAPKQPASIGGGKSMQETKTGKQKKSSKKRK